MAINGHDAFHCRGSALVVSDAASLQFGTGSFAIGMVFKTGFSGNSNSIGFWEKEGSSDQLALEYTTDQNLQFVLGVDKVTVGLPIDQFHSAVMRGPALQLYVDGATATGPLATGNADNVGNPLRLCASAGGNVEIAEVVAVKGALSDADLTHLQAYFHTKFGL